MSQIISLSKLPAVVHKVRQRQSSIVLATGVFDLLHSEHKKFLRAAKRQADFLLLGLETDNRVKKLKGKDRPVWPLQKRLQVLAKLPCVDFLFALPEKFNASYDHERLMAIIKPDILAISSHSPHQQQKKRLVEKYGGELRIVLDHNPIVSTSRLLSAKSSAPPLTRA